MAPILEARSIVKTYPGVTAVDGVDLAIEAGACFGLLGPNGAGKTTLIEIMEGIKRPDAGTALYEGAPIGARFRREAGIQFQATSLQEFLTVRETVSLFRELYPKAMELDELVRLLSLDEFLDRDTRKLSGGQRQRLLMALALVNDPVVLFLDEPTTGLDPQARRNFWDLIRMIKAQGKTIVLTTHYMEEAYELCDEIAIMDRGRFIARGTPEQLLRDHFGTVILQFPNEDVAGRLNGFPAPVVRRDSEVEIHTSDVDGTVKLLLERGASLSRMKMRSWNLEDLFIALTGKDLRA
ncbi:MAG: ABC transporter ATP-binding protein [Nitrospirae bacterium]|nr:ABC transporter ATP-binding protein [Nitrospirota bacterium]NTW66107.1 ABC transporter ATP-binding protein [Nitrospirota bacterium]